MEIKYYEVDLGEVISALREYFRGRNVVLVVLFGSVLRRREVRDVDVAVRFEREPDLGEVLEMGVELEEILGVPVDLVPIDYAPPHLRLKILRDGVLVFVKGRSSYVELLKEAMGDAQDLEVKLSQR